MVDIFVRHAITSRILEPIVTSRPANAALAVHLFPLRRFRLGIDAPNQLENFPGRGAPDAERIKRGKGFAQNAGGFKQGLIKGQAVPMALGFFTSAPERPTP